MAFRYVIQSKGHSYIDIKLNNPVSIGEVIALKPLYFRVKDIWHSQHQTVLYCETFEVESSE